MVIQSEHDSTKRCMASGFQRIALVHLFYFDVVSKVVIHVDIHAGAFVIWYDRQSIVRAVKGNPDRLPIADPIGEDHNRQGVEQVALDRAIEGTGPIDG